MRERWAAAFRAAFPHTLPILTGFLFLGAAYGILMRSAGFGFAWAAGASAIVFTGSAQFAIVPMLAGAYDPLGALALALLLGARHIFYGVSMLTRYAGTGLKKPFLIYTLCDESFSINCTVDAPPGVDAGRFMLAVSILNYSYWLISTMIGAAAGAAIASAGEGGLEAVRGIDFVLTALYVVIFTEQWLKERDHAASLLGLGMTAAALIIFGKSGFIVASMAGILAVLTAFRGRFEREGGAGL